MLEIMDDHPCFQLPISLQKYSAVRVSAILWKRADVIKDLEDILKSAAAAPSHELFGIRMKSPFEDETWWQITKKVIHLSETLNLPANVIVQLSEFIIFMGKNIYAMFLGIISDGIKFNPKLLNKIFFTNQGVLDRLKMHQEWKTDPRFPEFHDDTSKNTVIASYLACSYGDFDYLLRQPQVTVATAIGNTFGSDLELTDWNRVIAALLLRHKLMTPFESFTREQEDLKIRYESLFRNPKYPNGEEKLFHFCVTHGYEKAAKYFYSKLYEIDKEDMILPAAIECMNRNEHAGWKKRFPEEHFEKIVKIIFFVLKNMSKEKKKQFLIQEMTVVFPIFMKTWPYNYLCVELLDYVWEDLAEPAKSFILEICFRELYTLSILQHHNIMIHVCQKILQFLLRKTPADMKFDVFTHKNRSNEDTAGPYSHQDKRNGLFELFKNSDFLSLKMIITDPDLLQHREELINLTGPLTEYILKESDFELVKNKIASFMELLKFSNSEKDKYFKDFNKIEIFEQMIRDVRFSAVNKLLKWIYDSDREKMDDRLYEIREALDPAPIHSHIIENADCSAAERFLQWQFDGRYEELENFKNLNFSKEFICKTFWYTWVKNFYNNNFESVIARFECFKLLEHFFNTQSEADKFRNYSIVENDYCIKLFCSSLVKLQICIESEAAERLRNAQTIRSHRTSFLLNLADQRKCVQMTESKNFEAALNDALASCSASIHKINELKRSVKNNIDWWCDSYIENRYKFLILNAVINWVKFEKSELTMFYENFFKSSKGALLCVNIVEDRTGRAEANMILRDWIKQYRDVGNIIKEIGKLGNVNAADVIEQVQILSRS